MFKRLIQFVSQWWHESPVEVLFFFGLVFPAFFVGSFILWVMFLEILSMILFGKPF